MYWNFKAVRRRASLSELFMAKFVPCMHRNRFRYIALRFSDPTVLKERKNGRNQATFSGVFLENPPHF